MSNLPVLFLFFFVISFFLLSLCNSWYKFKSLSFVESSSKFESFILF